MSQVSQGRSLDTLSSEEQQWACVARTRQEVTTGKQAECHAINFIALHLSKSGGGIRAQIAASQKAEDRQLPAAQKQLADVLGIARQE